VQKIYVDGQLVFSDTSIVYAHDPGHLIEKFTFQVSICRCQVWGWAIGIVSMTSMPSLLLDLGQLPNCAP
jgi:hypothetical protein